VRIASTLPRSRWTIARLAGELIHLGSPGRPAMRKSADCAYLAMTHGRPVRMRLRNGSVTSVASAQGRWNASTPDARSAAAPPAATEGLYVFVRDGHVTIASANEVLNLGRNEAGFAGAMVLRLESLPLPLSTGFRTGIVNDLVQRTNTSMMCPR